MPPSPGYGVVPRVLRTPFVEEWHGRSAAAGEQAEQLRAQIMATVRERRPELTPFTGQTAGLIGDVLPAGEIVRRMARDACAALRDGARRCG